MATELAPHTDTADLTYERFRAALEGEGNYPRDAAFIDAEAPFARAALLRNVREGRPVVIVFPDGQEKVLKAANPGFGFRAIVTSFWHRRPTRKERLLH